jgi:hypothetical protein
MQTYFHFMPIDRTKIKTRLRIHPDLLDDPKSYLTKHGIEIRTSKPSKGKSKRGPTQNLTLDVLSYKGIKAKLRKVTGYPLTDVTIDFNPGVCLYGHNGAALSLTEFLHALAILVTHLKPLLGTPDDWIDLVPGLRPRGVAYWDYLELFLQRPDPDGTLLAGFRNTQRKNGQTPIRHWSESMVIGGKRSDLLFGIYRKAVEMVAKDKLLHEQMESYQHILRLEVRLKGDKLVHYLGNERNVEEIDGVPRLVRFYPQDPVSGHRTSFSDLHGVFGSSEPLETLKPNDQLTPLGRLLARAALDPRTSHTFQELLAHIRFYTGASTDTMGKIRNAGIALLENLSTISKDELFSDEAYRIQPSVWSEKREKKVRHEFEDTFVHPLIYKAYWPPNLPFQPITQLPEYLRVRPKSESPRQS